MFTGATMGEIMREMGPAAGPDAELGRTVVLTIVVVVIAAQIIKSAIIIFGSINMMKRESWGLALTAGILTMVPCNFCCFLELPIGIWAVVVLSQSHIRNTFS
jgi:hypothetical protein